MPIGQTVAEELRRVVGRDWVIDSPNDLRIFERDGSIEGAAPAPASPAERSPSAEASPSR
jgi:hypothetical protein